MIKGQRLVIGVLVCVATHPDYRHRGYPFAHLRSRIPQDQRRVLTDTPQPLTIAGIFATKSHSLQESNHG